MPIQRSLTKLPHVLIPFFVVLMVAQKPGFAADSPSSQEFFPKETQLDPVEATWFSSQLKGFNEKPLKESVPDAETFRFLWLRSYHPICITIHVHSQPSNTCTLQAKESDRMTNINESPARLLKDVTYVLSLDREKALLKHINKIFWQLDSYDVYTTPKALRPKNEKCIPMMHDGSFWILEGWNQEHYHLVVRWSPNSGPVLDLGTTLLKTAGMLPAHRQLIY